MSHEWDRGVLNQSSWHGLEEVGTFVTAEDLIQAGELSGSWPIELTREDQYIQVGEHMVKGGEQAIIAMYREHAPRWVGNVGSRFNATDPERWRGLVKAAVAAGASPTGAFSLRGGSRVLATFEVANHNGIRTNLMVADAFDGTMKLSCGFTSIRVVCANTLSAAMSADSKNMAKLSHTSSINEKAHLLEKNIAKAIERGSHVRDLYEAAMEKRLNNDDAEELLHLLFPDPKEENATQAALTRAQNRRLDAISAAALRVNKEGTDSSAATLWNAATWLVDRKFDPSGRPMARKPKGGQMLDAMLFGTRAKRIAEIEQVMIQVLRADGTEESVPVDKAIEMGVPPDQMGESLLNSMLEDVN